MYRRGAPAPCTAAPLATRPSAAPAANTASGVRIDAMVPPSEMRRRSLTGAARRRAVESPLMLDSLLAWLVRLPTLPTYGVLMLLSAVENVFPPVPADVAVTFGAFLAQRGEVSALPLGMLCWLANTASSAGMYFLARRHAEVFRSGWGRRLLTPGSLVAFERAYARHGALGIFLSRFLPGFRAAVTPMAGLFGVAPLRALVPAGLASAFWYAFLIVIGSALGLSWEGIKAFLAQANRALALLAVGAAVLLALWLRRRARAGP